MFKAYFKVKIKKTFRNQKNIFFLIKKILLPYFADKFFKKGVWNLFNLKLNRS